LIKIIEGVIFKFTIDRVHLRDFKVDNLDEVVGVWYLCEYFLFTYLELFLLDFLLGCGCGLGGRIVIR